MGKYINKASVTPDVSLMDLGVLTRAKTLALQRRLQSDVSFLQLRSRRLEKPPLYNKRKNPNKKKQGDEQKSPPEKQRSGSGRDAIEKGEAQAEEIEPCVGENDLDSEAQGRRTRESTPSHLIVPADNVKMPPTTKRRMPTVANQSTQPVRNNCTSGEMEELLARMDHSDKQDQQRFIEKYNFDVVNDKPLDGRYSWEPVPPSRSE